MAEAEKQRINFHLRQFVDAMSPSLLLVSNPVALRRAMETGGASLAEGARNLLDDLKEGRLSMVDATAFAPGRNLALTPGKVVHRNKLIELIQYAPKTETVYATPLLIIPPWINKYYILDLQPKNSMVAVPGRAGLHGVHGLLEEPGRVDGGHHHRGLHGSRPAGGERRGARDHRQPDRQRDGLLHRRHAAGDDAGLAGGEGRRRGSTRRRSWSRCRTSPGSATRRCSSASRQIDFIEQQMMERGYLDSREMSNMFNLLRANDLIWSNVVNNYLMGQKPPAFDLLYWNSDGTRMARAAHSWYLRNTYLENNLIKPGKVHAEGRGDRSRAASSWTSTRSARRRTTSCRGTRPGASPSSRAARSASCWRPAATSPA